MTSYTFNNANGGYWEVEGNWSPSGVPGTGDDAVDVGLQLAVDMNQAAATLTLAGGAELDLYGGTLVVEQALDMTGGSALLVYGGTLDLGGQQSAAYAATVTFADMGTLRLEQAGGSAALNPTVLGFGTSGTIDLAGFAPAAGATVVLNGSVLDITFDPAATSGPDVEIQLDDTVAGLGFVLNPDGAGGTLVQVACFCRGTGIATPGGEAAVEELRAGDLVCTADGGHEPVRWVGRRSYGGRFLRGAARLHPVRIAAGALGAGLPRRDLLVSPEHAVLLDGVLVAARDLVNGRTVTRDSGRREVEYFHVELDRHAVLLAEGAATESFIDHDSAGLFLNAHERPARPSPLADCAPRVSDGFRLEAIRARLLALAEEAGAGALRA